MYRIRKSALALALKDTAPHTFAVYKHPDGFIFTLDGTAMLETERGDIRKFRKLEAIVSLAQALDITHFTVSLRPESAS